jgi:hypothetical protein
MSSVIISGDTSGAITVSAPAVAGTNTLTLQAATATNSVNTLATAVASTSGTSIDFTSLPSWIKRITVMFSGVSTNGTSNMLVQIGSGSVTTSGYNSAAAGCINGVVPAVAVSTAGFLMISDTATDVKNGLFTIVAMGSNLYAASHTMGGDSTRDVCFWGGGSVTLSGALDRIRLTTVNGTDTFDAGSVNILYEG